MKNFVKDLLMIVVATVVLFWIFIGAILQESYRLCPVTEAEIMEVQK